MSRLGILSIKARREGAILKDLNDALLVMEVAALGKDDKFEFSANDISKSKEYIGAFTAKLSKNIEEISSSEADFNYIIEYLKNDGNRSIDDWADDLKEFENEIKSQDIPRYESLEVLENIIYLLDSRFTEDTKQLYYR